MSHSAAKSLNRLDPPPRRQAEPRAAKRQTSGSLQWTSTMTIGRLEAAAVARRAAGQRPFLRGWRVPMSTLRVMWGHRGLSGLSTPMPTLPEPPGGIQKKPFFRIDKLTLYFVAVAREAFVIRSIEPGLQTLDILPRSGIYRTVWTTNKIPVL